MGLIHWWPLNGNTNDLGLNPVSLQTSTTFTYNSAGKIGQCAKSTQTGLTISELANKTVFSCSVWWKVSSTEATTHYSNIVCFGIKDSSNNTGSIRYDNENYSTNTGAAMHCHDNGTGRFTNGITFNAGITNPYNTWHHYVMTSDGTNVKFYCDGNVIGNATVKSGSYLTGGFSANTIAGVWVNDIRIYDHVLSAKEVKEISKGLVLHYNFEDTCSNLIPAFGANSGQGISIDNTTHPFNLGPIYKLSQSGNTSNVYRGLSYTIPGLKAGDVISMSCWIYTEDKSSLDSGSELRVFQQHNDGSATNWSGISWLGQQINGKWCYYSRQYTLDSNLSSATFNANVVKNGTYWITGIKVEYGSVATSFDGYKETLSTIYDNSGYGNNGTVTGSPQIVSDTVSGQHSIYFPANTVYIKLPALSYSGFANTYTFSWWAKKTDMNGSMAWGFSDGNRLNLYPTGSVICWNTGDGANNPFKNNGSSISYSQWNNGWHLFTVTGNGTATKLYVDGQEVGTATTYKALTGTQIYISGWDTGTSYKWIGNIADYKIYSTALSAEDILAEYNRKAVVDRNGKLLTGEFIEQDSFELTPGVYLGSDANYVDNGYAASTVTKDADSSLILTNTTWVATPKFNVTYGDTYYYDIVYSNTSGNQFYLGYEQYDDAGNSGSNNLCRYLISGDTNARDHYRIKGTITVNSITSASTQVTKWKLRVLNAWNGSSSSKIAKIHHISLRKVSTLTPAKIDKSNFIVANDFREDVNYTTAQLYKDGFVGAREIIEN